MKSTKSNKDITPAGRGAKVAVAGAAVTGIAAGVAYFAYRRRRTDTSGMLDEQTMLGISSPSAGKEIGEPDVEMNGPEHLTEPLAEMAHGPDNPQ
jgi:hypothetical protein